MELRTTFNIEPFNQKITYNDKVMFIGSCFASAIGKRMENGHMPVMINPAGAVFNPVSVCNTLDSITREKQFIIDDLHFYDGTWISFNHYTDFSSHDPLLVLNKINSRLADSSDFLKRSSFLFITFGTARAYRLKKTGMIVSNCHKIPSQQFEPVLLRIDEIVQLWTQQLDKLNHLYPDLRVVFTVSPVRHWKDGAHGNQISKSVLMLSIEELLKHKTAPSYFPSYELLMDDLRDYRFYDDDMLHPSASAINYIWDAFANCYLDSSAVKIRTEAEKITKAFNHRMMTESESKKIIFADRLLEKISVLKKKVPSLDFSVEEEYFVKMRNMGMSENQ